MSARNSNFYSENEVKVGHDFQVGTPLYYASLSDGFSHYFNTIRDMKTTYHFTIDSLSSPKYLSSASVPMIDNCSLSILSFHRFFELYIKDVLARLNPFLAVKFLDNEYELFNFFDGKLDSTNVKSVEFSQANKRLMRSFKHFDKDREESRKLDKIRFLSEPNNQDALNTLTNWRNRIIHNGNTLPNIAAYEFLISQQIIPIVLQIYNAEKEFLKGWEPHYFKTLTGMEIVSEICSIKFLTKDSHDKELKQKIINDFLFLGHLKELGRASFSQDYAIRNNRNYYESDYDDPIGRTERFALSESNHQEFYSLLNCNCCGSKSMVVYRKPIDDFFDLGKHFISWFKCFNCDYSLKDNMLDPFNFGLARDRIFPTE